MRTDAEKWAGMQLVSFVRFRMGDTEALIVRVGNGRDMLPVNCPVCGEPVEVVRRRVSGGKRLYYTWHEGELHDLGVFGGER